MRWLRVPRKHLPSAPAARAHIQSAPERAPLSKHTWSALAHTQKRLRSLRNTLPERALSALTERSRARPATRRTQDKRMAFEEPTPSIVSRRGPGKLQADKRRTRGRQQRDKRTTRTGQQQDKREEDNSTARRGERQDKWRSAARVQGAAKTRRTSQPQGAGQEDTEPGHRGGQEEGHGGGQEEDKAWRQSPATEFRGAAKRRTRPGPQSSEFRRRTRGGQGLDTEEDKGWPNHKRQEEDKASTQSPATEDKRRTRPRHRAQPQSSGGQLLFSKIEPQLRLLVAGLEFQRTLKIIVNNKMPWTKSAHVVELRTLFARG